MVGCPGQLAGSWQRVCQWQGGGGSVIGGSLVAKGSHTASSVLGHEVSESWLVLMRWRWFDEVCQIVDCWFGVVWLWSVALCRRLA